MASRSAAVEAPGGRPRQRWREGVAAGALWRGFCLFVVAGVAHAEGRPAFGGSVVAPLESPLNQLDPARASRRGEQLFARLVFDTPFAFDAAGRPRPRLLERIEVLEPTRVRLVLRPGLRFHNGHPLLAADLAASLVRGARLGSGWMLAPLRDARAVSESVVELDLFRPAPDLPALLCSVAASVTPGGRALAGSVIGSGAFRYVSLDARALRLAANPAHVDGQPYLEALTLRWFASRTEEAGSYEVGTSQVSLHGATAFEGGATKHPSAIRDGTRTLTLALAFGDPGTARGLPDDPSLRRAIAAAIDRERLRRLAVRDPSLPARGLVPGATNRAALDLAAARAEIARRSGGRRLRATLILDAARFSDREVADKLLAQLAAAGIDLQVEALDGKEFVDRLDHRAYDLALVEAGAAGGIDQPGLAALALVAAIAPQAARELLQRAPADAAAIERWLGERVWLTPLFHRAVRVHHRADLRDLEIDPTGRVDYAGAHFGG